MDSRLRLLERQALLTRDPIDLSNYLIAAYRAGLYRAPNRKEIIKILRNQVRSYRGRRRLQPRFYASAGTSRYNKSELQHPDEVSSWDGEYVEWEQALRMAMPGDVFEVSIYLLGLRGEPGQGDLDSIITLSVPPLIVRLGDKYYGPPES